MDPIEERDVEKILGLLDETEVRMKIIEIIDSQREKMAELILDVAPYTIANQLSAAEVLRVVDFIKKHVRIRKGDS